MIDLNKLREELVFMQQNLPLGLREMARKIDISEYTLYCFLNTKPYSPKTGPRTIRKIKKFVENNLKKVQP